MTASASQPVIYIYIHNAASQNQSSSDGWVSRTVWHLCERHTNGMVEDRKRPYSTGATMAEKLEGTTAWYDSGC